MNTPTRLHRSTNLAGYTHIILAAMLWGTTGTTQALAPIGANPLTIGAIRILVGGLALLLLAWVRGGFRQRTTWHLPTTLTAIGSTALYQLTFFIGTDQTGVAIGTILAIGSAPVFTGILGILFERESPSARWYLATALAILGCAVLAIAENNLQADVPGILAALGAGLSYAVFTLTNKRLVRDHLPDEVMAVSFCGGAILLLPILFIFPTDWIFSTGGVVVVLHLGLIATGLSYALFGRGLHSVPIATVGTLTLAEPLTAAILAIIVVGEMLTVSALIGIGLLFTGLVVLVLPRGR